jgi:hypothetical protein
MRADRDKRARAMAGRIGRDFPQWLVIWGTYSRVYWAYPTFPVPRGTLVHSSDPGELARQMREIQLSGGQPSKPRPSNLPGPAIQPPASPADPPAPLA